MKNIDIIIQARMGATRLPGKILLPLMGKTILECVVDRAKTSKTAGRVIVATTLNSLDDRVENLCKEKKYLYYRGSESDVLDRYFETAKKFGSEIIVRVTADNPFTDIQELDRNVLMLLQEDLAYVGGHKRGIPNGMGSEVFTFSALLKAHEEGKLPFHREHVTPYFYENPSLFRQQEAAPLYILKDAASMRLTLDTPEDYALLQKIEESFEGKLPESRELFSFLEEHPEIRGINQEIKQKTYRE